MKLKLFFAAMIILLCGQVFAQSYPEVTIRNIQYLSPDTLNMAPHDYKSPYEGDTVIVTGVVEVAPYYGANPDSSYIMRIGGTGLLLQDEFDHEYSGLIVKYIGTDAADFKLLDTGMVVKLKGFVKEYYTTTQFNVFEFTSADVIGITNRPKPLLLTLDSLSNIGTSTPVYTAEKYEGMYVEIRNVTTSDPGAMGGGSFTIFDENGTQVVVGIGSTWIYTAAAPIAGTKLEYIRGYVETRNNMANGWFLINPCYRNDIKLGDVIPPRISNVTRNKVYAALNEPVIISAKIKDPDGTIASAKLNYKISETGTFQTIDMAPVAVGDSIYTATIPAQATESLIAYYLEAKDNNNATSTNPTNTTTGLYFYNVLNRPLTIKDVQYSPFGSGYSGYNGYNVTVSGVITCDTTDLVDGTFSSAQVYLQDGTGPWSGIKLYGTEVLKLHRGDAVTVTGAVYENYNVTEIKGLDDAGVAVVTATGVAVPEATVISTSKIGTSVGSSLPAESYEGVLVKYDSLTVIDDNADGESGPVANNFGEILVADASNIQTRVELQDGGNDYNNFWDASLENSAHRVRTGDKFESLTGVLYFSYSNYKLIPRKNDDFVGHVSVGVDEETNTLPSSFVVSQNYPNPFNPSTKIQFSIPENSFVTVKVYNTLGQEIRTLVNSNLNRGNHSVVFNATNFSSGVYFYRVEAGNFSSIKKMILMK